jgi:hypothetical protein
MGGKFTAMRYVNVSILILCALGAQAVLQAVAPDKAPQRRRKIECKTAENAATCYWTRGRLNSWNGEPPYRIWKVGTERILAVYGGPSRFPPRTDDDSELPELPAEIDRVFRPPDNRIFADFEVCPLEPEKVGEMQSVCIESAKNIFVQRAWK